MSSKTDTVKLAIEKVLQLQAGAILDQLVFLCPVNESPDKIHEIVSPSSNLESALRIFSGHRSGCGDEFGGITYMYKTGWRCILDEIVADAETLPLAICRAFVADNCWFVLGDYDGYPDDESSQTEENKARFMAILGLDQGCMA